MTGDNAMRKDSLHRLSAPLHLCNGGLMISRVQPADIAHLPTRIGIEAGRIEHDLARLTGLQRLHPDAILH